MAKALGFLIRHFSNYYTLHRSDLAARAAPLDPRLYIINKVQLTVEPNQTAIFLLFQNQNKYDENFKLLPKLPGKAVIYESVAPSLKCSSLDDSGDESDVYGDDERQTKGKHIKWKMDYEENQHGND